MAICERKRPEKACKVPFILLLNVYKYNMYVNGKLR